MRSTFALLALAATALASPMPQGVTENITPSASAPEGCAASHPAFQITVVNVTKSAKRDIAERQTSGVLTLTLDGGILKDQAGRTGYIASNFQFQFDAPPQTGAIFTGGFSVCGNGSLALGGSAVFYQCLSGEFFNLYDRHWAAQCSPIYIEAIGGSKDSSPVPPSTASVTAASDGQVIATSVAQIPDGQVQATTIPAPVTQLADGQPNAGGAPVVTQINDGQPQAPTAQGPAVTQLADGQPQAPTAQGPAVTQLADGQPQAPTAQGPAVTQIADGQPQAPTAAGPAVTQIADGQPQAPTAAGPAVTQIADGQPQAPTAQGPAVTQIADGQPQAPTAAGAAVTQIADGQPQAPTGAAVTQIADGQPQAPTGASNATVAAAATPSQFLGAASAVSVHKELIAMAVGVIGAIALL